MYSQAATVRRIDVLLRILRGHKTVLSLNNVRAFTSGDKVVIGDVSKEVGNPSKIEYVPRKYCK